MGKSVLYDNPVYQPGDSVVITSTDGTLTELINGESVTLDEVPEGLENDPNVTISGKASKHASTKSNDEEGGEE